MSFVFALALLALVFVGVPYFAHRLKRRRADARPFAPAHLVPPAPPRARRRSELEDRALFATRALAVVALALLGASPWVSCSRLSLSRASGASVALALVVDDSMSMQSRTGGATRFARAREGAREILVSTREGDSVAVVLAGARARVALAPTTDLAAARGFVDGLTPTDRGTDLEAAIALGRTLVEAAPQVDRRVVVLSDLADGHPDAPPLGEGSSVPVWNALPAIRSDGFDCAVVRADRAGLRVRVRVACTPDVSAPPAPRAVALMQGEKVLAEAAAPSVASGDVVLHLPEGSGGISEEPGILVATLRGGDAVAADDAAPVVAEAAPGSVAVVVPTDSETAATGGAPVVEQALSALQLDVAVRPLPQIPDRPEDLSAFVGVLLDDPPGLTPEERRAVGAFVERGGVLLVALGPRAADPPLGASLAPFLDHGVSWSAITARGADPASAAGPLAESATSLRDLAAGHRAALSPEDAAPLTTLLAWTDGAPLVARRRLGRGEVWLVTLPFALDASDLPLRAGFLTLLEAWLDAARARTVPRRTEVGQTWAFPAAHAVTVTGPGGQPVAVVPRGDGLAAVPEHIGVYRLTVDGRAEVRVAEAVPSEVDLRPRRLAVSAAGKSFGDNRSRVDASPALAMVLLSLLTLELALRVYASRKATAAAAGA